jgi:hypothetical protein
VCSSDLIGEEIVAKIFGAKLSENAYDENADMYMPDGTSIEVKTQYPYKNLSTVNVNQLPKCLSAHRLIFVIYDETDVVQVLELPQKSKTRFTTYKTKDGRVMAGWPITEMVVIEKIKDAKLAFRFQTLSTSNVLRNKLKPYHA